jgi:hypothetical protein
MAKSTKDIPIPKDIATKMCECNCYPYPTYRCQIIHVFVGLLDCLLKDDTGVGNVPMALIELGERNPQGVGLAQGPVHVNSLHV